MAEPKRPKPKVLPADELQEVRQIYARFADCADQLRAELVARGSFTPDELTMMLGSFVRVYFVQPNVPPEWIAAVEAQTKMLGRLAPPE